MPHKLYDCCDSNRCTCGNFERHGFTRDYAQEAKELAEKQAALLTFSTEELEKELKTRQNKKALDRIKELETELETLRKELK